MIILLITLGFVTWWILGSVTTGLLFRFWGEPADAREHDAFWVILLWPALLFLLLLTGLFSLGDRIIKKVHGK